LEIKKTSWLLKVKVGAPRKKAGRAKKPRSYKNTNFINKIGAWECIECSSVLHTEIQVGAVPTSSTLKNGLYRGWLLKLS